jgi:hypothetical protein
MGKRGFRWRALRVALVGAAVAALAAVAAGSALAKVIINPATGQPVSIVPSIGSPLVQPNSCTTDCSALTYHFGPVQHGAQNEYSIFWAPAGHSFPSVYTSGLSTWWSNVQKDDYKASNVFAVTQQYYDLSGPGGAKAFVPYGITKKSQTIDTHAYPASGCSDGVVGDTVCLSDAQIRTEISRLIAAKGWATGLFTQFYVFLPQHVGECFGSGGSCFNTSFCAYHDWTGSYLYAVMPYTYQSAGCDANAYFGLGYANLSPIDPEVGVLSHEISETMTDPEINAWKDGSGNEIGDKCAYTYGSGGYGSPSGLPNNGNGFYNQTINGGQYLMQQEFSNREADCVSQDLDTQPKVSVVISPTSPTHGVSATFTANVTDPAGVSQVLWDFGDGTSGVTGSPAHHTYAAAGTYKVKVIVTDNHGNTKKSTKSVTVS